MRDLLRRARPRLAGALSAAVVVMSLGSTGLPGTAAAASSRPARTLYKQAQTTEGKLRKSSKLQTSRAEWEKAVLAYRKVVARYPRSGYCDNALLGVGNLYREMASRFRSDHYRSDAISAYRMLVKEYPSSSLGDDALWAIVEIEKDRGDRSRLVKAGKSYLASFPRGKRASKVKNLMKKKAPATKVPTPPPPGLARVFDLRFWSGKTSTRVVLDLESKVELESDRVGNPERLWIDLVGTRLHPNLAKRLFPVGDGLLERIRIAQNRPGAVRVVLDFKGSWRAQRLLSRRAPPPGGGHQGPARPAGPGGRRGPAGGTEGRHLVPGRTRAAPKARGRARKRARRRPTKAPPPTPEARADLPPPEPPAANRAGSYSLARQLGPGRPSHRHRPGPRRSRSRDHRAQGAAGEGPGPGRVPPPAGASAQRAGRRGPDDPLHRRLRPPGGAHRRRQHQASRPVPLHPRQRGEELQGRGHRDVLPQLRPEQPRRGGGGPRERHLPGDPEGPPEPGPEASPSPPRSTRARTSPTRSRRPWSRASAAPTRSATGGCTPPPSTSSSEPTCPRSWPRSASFPTPQPRSDSRPPPTATPLARSLYLGVKAYLEALSRNQTRQLTQSRRRSTVPGGTPSR